MGLGVVLCLMSVLIPKHGIYSQLDETREQEWKAEKWQGGKEGKDGAPPSRKCCCSFGTIGTVGGGKYGTLPLAAARVLVWTGGTLLTLSPAFWGGYP